MKKRQWCLRLVGAALAAFLFAAGSGSVFTVHSEDKSASKAEIKIDNFSFAPGNLTIAAGRHGRGNASGEFIDSRMRHHPRESEPPYHDGQNPVHVTSLRVPRAIASGVPCAGTTSGVQRREARDGRGRGDCNRNCRNVAIA